MNELTLVEITPENWRQFTRLEIAESQRGQVASNVLMLARAYVFREEGARARGICVDGEPVGLLLQRQSRDDDQQICILDQLMIAREHQGRGYGTAVIRQWIQQLREQEPYKVVNLCYVDGHHDLRRFYERLGFQPNGVVDNDEIVMELKLGE